MTAILWTAEEHRTVDEAIAILRRHAQSERLRYVELTVFGAVSECIAEGVDVRGDTRFTSALPAGEGATRILAEDMRRHCAECEAEAEDECAESGR